ncbi:transketolase C-terminal domain-containing protein [Thermanaeromonas sp. C210]|uniref:transketolase C-terminal domain-containing protein n=1 Tax=Thermanaeromonas sp. C210 TaxID=2731925 RepID=UPI00155B4856|nr:transketolase C-terminal domain-containing protein [Thermanaeromonas sp. C210]GFN21847.1 pyruvate ferredoxin oxidoreductase subunit alpha [Thermanaeromonas sp. C210]
MRELLNGNEAAAEAARLARIEVLASYPITPAAPVMERLTGFIAQGTLKARFIRVESDHSALAAAAGAALAGGRTLVVTNSQGIAYMSEVLYHVSGLRLPVVMAVVNRALAAPHSRFPDHGDAVAQEACGWIQLFCENNQEVLDTVIQAYRLAEDDRVRLPVMVNYESYIQSHTREVVEVPEEEIIDGFLPLNRRAALDVDNPRAINVVTGPDLYMDYKYRQDAALRGAAKVLAEVSGEYGRLTGRNWGGPVEGYRLQEAGHVLVTMGSLVSTCREAVDQLRAAGEPAGLLKIRAFRPFPVEEVREYLKGVKTVTVLDKNIVYGSGGALAREVRAALYGEPEAPPVFSYIAGLGGRDVTSADVCKIFGLTQEKRRAGAKPPAFEWYGLE